MKDIEQLMMEYHRMVAEKGADHAREYMYTLCEIISEDTSEPIAVRDGVKAILETFRKYESKRKN